MRSCRVPTKGSTQPANQAGKEVVLKRQLVLCSSRWFDTNRKKQQAGCGFRPRERGNSDETDVRLEGLVKQCGYWQKKEFGEFHGAGMLWSCGCSQADL